ncbi:hypothetical protein STSP2_01217 [Anaerohalosphaera lusitana]|uniref:Uncharacterized protein n=1 Tax=Anaerohalosphaera lusitana TaxID=1936003 RepID=A0A1U9NJF4_9BACT|nr:hypothetical protein STSP2_01217 [Anaerohalosphaera lusitana]
MSSEKPFNDLVPKDFAANLAFRRERIWLGWSDEKAAQERSANVSPIICLLLSQDSHRNCIGLCPV